MKINQEELLAEAIKLVDEIDEKLMVAIEKSIIKNVIADENFISVIDTVTVTAFTMGRVYERLIQKGD